MAKVLFLTNMERQLWLWQKADAALQANATALERDGALVDASTPWTKAWASRVGAADFVICRWMGSGLDCRFLRGASELMQARGIRHVFQVGDAAAGDRLHGGLDEAKRMLLQRYLISSGVENFRQCLLWLAREFFGEAHAVAEPAPLPWHGLYHPDAAAPYGDLASYARDFWKEGRPVVAVLFYRDEWILEDLAYQAALVRAIEGRGMNALALFSNTLPDETVGMPPLQTAFEKFLLQDGRVVVDVVVSCMKFSWTTSDAVTLPFLQRLGVPILQAYTLVRPRAQWEESFEGLTPMEVSIGVSLPEFDGVLHAVPAASREADDDFGLYRYQPVSERVQRIARKAEKWVRLRRAANGEKKIAIVFHNYPALNSNIGSAAGLDSPESVRRLLAEMARRGYDVGEIPPDSQAFIEELIANATNDRRYSSERQIAAAEKLTAAQYAAFFKPLPEKVKARLTADWGDAPGEVFQYDGALLVPGTLKGNVFVTVQPPRGFEEDPSKLLHSPDSTPTHHYIGVYHWLRDLWQADAVVHVGTHGSLEWLPGKGAGLSDACYPDISLGDLPNVYPYWMTIVGEGMQAKRRGAACLIGHLSPPMRRADTYEELAELEKALDEYHHFNATQPEHSEVLEALVREKAAAAHLTEDLPEEEGETFDAYAQRIHAYVTDIKNMQIRTGLHVLGQPPEGEDLVEYLLALAQYKNGELPSLFETLAAPYGVPYETLLANGGHTLAATGGTYAAAVDAIRAEAQSLVEALAAADFAADRAEEIARRLSPQLSAETLAQCVCVLAAICDKMVPALRRTAQEIDNYLAALDGRYVEPGPGGAPTAGGADLLPSGRNFYGVDPRALPTPAAWEIGKTLGEEVVSRYILEEGRYPECVGIVLWAGANMRSHGQCIAEFLYLMGLRPIWQRGSLRVVDVEVIPLAELKRPRIDVTGRISGLFRETMPSAVAWLDKAVETVAALDEDLQMNFVRKHVLADASELEAQGVDAESAWEQASYRIFGDPPGAYGAGVGAMLEAKNWETLADLAQVYTRFSGHAYGAKGRGAYRPELFQKRMAALDVTIKNEDNRESHMLSSDDFNAYHGGMIATVRALSGKAPRSYCGDSSNRAEVKLRSLQEEVKRLFRGEAINPKFIEGMQKHGYKGAQDLANYVAHSYQWDATSAVLDDWMYEKYAEKYAFDPKVQAWMKEVNPWALQRLTETLLEAQQRGLWNAKPETLEELQQLYLSIEGDLEERGDA